MKKEDIEKVTDTSDFYEAFNRYMISGDLKVFGKTLARTLLLQKVINVPGDIVECGVFKGTGIFNFLKLKRYFFPNSHRKVIGFDFFHSQELVNSLSGQDKQAMDMLFKGRDFQHHSKYKEYLENTLLNAGFNSYEFELVAGDVSQTTVDYINNNPGFRVALLYLDLDLAKPTYDVLNTLWSRLSTGGIVVFDEYAYGVWSEANGVDQFLKEHNLELQPLNYMCPTAYLIKN